MPLLRVFVAAVIATVLAAFVGRTSAAAQACEFHVSPVWINVLAAGQTGTITVETQPGCAWSASVTTSVPSSFPLTYVSIDSASGTGPGVITYTAAAFPSRWDWHGRLRQARVQIRWNTPTRGQDVILTQQDGPCAVEFIGIRGAGTTFGSSFTVGPEGGSGAIEAYFDGGWFMTTTADWIALSPPSGIVQFNTFTLGDEYRQFTVTPNPGSRARSATIVGCNGQTFAIRQAGRAPAASGTSIVRGRVAGDFDGDGNADPVIYRPGTVLNGFHGQWQVLLSSTDYASELGIDSDARADADHPDSAVPITGDFDGDGRSDVAVFTMPPGLTSLEAVFRYSSAAYSVLSATYLPRFGSDSAVRAVQPLAANFDGTAQFTFVTYNSSSGRWTSDPWANIPERQGTVWGGSSDDRPVPADYDGDGVTDLAVWRASEGRWYVLNSSTAYDKTRAREYVWGINGDIPFAGDFDGDGRVDPATYRPSTGMWYVLFSSLNYNPAAPLGVQWGVQSAGDIPVPADYDGDGLTDIAVWRPSNGTWYLLLSSTDYNYSRAREIRWGSNAFGDRPVSPLTAGR